jgi:hypothetical protein
MRLTPASGWVDLLHRASGRQVAQVDRGEPRVLEHRDDIRFRVGVVPGDEDHAPAAGLLRIRSEHLGAKCVAGFHDTCAGDEVGDELAGRSPLEIVGGPVVGRVDDNLTTPGKALDGFRHPVPGHGDDDDAGRCCFVCGPWRDSLAKGGDN